MKWWNVTKYIYIYIYLGAILKYFLLRYISLTALVMI